MLDLTSLGMIAKELTLPISAIEIRFGMSKNRCNEFTDGLTAILGIFLVFLVSGGLLCTFFSMDDSDVDAEGSSFLSLPSFCVIVSVRCQNEWSGGGIRKGMPNIKQAARVGTAPAT